MESLTSQAQKGGPPATPPFTLYPLPFAVYWDDSDVSDTDDSDDDYEDKTDDDADDLIKVLKAYQLSGSLT